eukprot:Awhi_evm1s6693
MDSCIPPKAFYEQRKNYVINYALPCLGVYFNSHFAASISTKQKSLTLQLVTLIVKLNNLYR